MFRTTYLMAAVLICGAVTLFADAAEPGGKTKIVLIGHAPDHPHGTHAYLPDCKLLAKCLQQTPGVEAIVSDGWPKDPAVLKDVKAIVLHVRLGGDLLFAEDHRDQAAELMKKGVGLTAIHWGTGASEGENGERWLKTLGGWFNTKFCKIPVETATIRRADEKHPVCAGWKDIEIKDEYYIKLRFDPAAKPVVKAKVSGEDYDIGWVFERPDSRGGRSFGFVGGHFHDNFGNDHFRRALVNGILWTAHVEVPDKGAPCKIEKADMELPPPAEAAAGEKKMQSVHEFVMKDIDGQDKPLKEYRGKVVLMVNVASKCGYTPQYTGLQELYTKFKDKGLVVLGVPSNDFGKQEPGSEKEIKEFCSTKFHVTFPMLAKVSVKNGPEQCSLYQYLTSKAKNGVLDATVGWNFNKFLIGKDGKPIKYYDSKVKPESEQLAKDIEGALAAK